MVCSKEDWNAVMASEVFREYLKSDIHQKPVLKSQIRPLLEDTKTLVAFEKFEEKVRNTPEMKTAFKTLQERFRTDPEYTAKVDPLFVEGVMLLDLSGPKES